MRSRISPLPPFSRRESARGRTLVVAHHEETPFRNRGAVGESRTDCPEPLSPQHVSSSGDALCAGRRFRRGGPRRPWLSVASAFLGQTLRFVEPCVQRADDFLAWRDPIREHRFQQCVSVEHLIRAGPPRSGPRSACRAPSSSTACALPFSPSAGRRRTQSAGRSDHIMSAPPMRSQCRSSSERPPALRTDELTCYLGLITPRTWHLSSSSGLYTHTHASCLTACGLPNLRPGAIGVRALSTFPIAPLPDCRCTVRHQCVTIGASVGPTEGRCS